MLTVEELSKMFNVSTKTISRWRQQGLVSRRFVFDGRKRVGFLQSRVERFVAQQRGPRAARRALQPAHATKSATTSSSAARRLARAGGCPAEVARRVAQRMNRSVETVRYTLKQFDQEHPDLAVFPEQHAAR